MAQCGRHIWISGEDRPCHQTVGLVRWWDSSGRQHAACRYHLPVMMSLYPIGDPPEPAWLTPEPPQVTWTDAGWTEAELREAFGG
jgi:hypothetical protein